jgi:predicted kinase
VHISRTLIVMRGYPGTGKSTIARAIAHALDAPIIDRDIIRQTAVDILGNLPEIGRFSYELMFALTKEQLKQELSVVIDTPLTYRTTYEQAQELANSSSIPMLVVHCQCPPEVQRSRLEGRKGKVSQFQITSWEEWQRWQPRFEIFDVDGCIIDTSQPIHDSVTKVLHCLHVLHEQYDHRLRKQEISSE